MATGYPPNSPYTPNSPYPPYSPYGDYRYDGPHPGQSLQSLPGADPLLVNASNAALAYSDGAPANAPYKSYTPDMANPRWADSRPAKKSRSKYWLVAAGVVLVVAAAVIIPIYIFVIRPKSDSDDAAAESHGKDGKTTPASLAVVTGGDGTTVTKTDGTTFTYKNAFGGYWYHDPDAPYMNWARPNMYTPPLNQSWDYSTDRIYGVNIGGLFVLEPFISPALFELVPGTKDEWELSAALAAQGKLEEVMSKHYDTFITEEDVAGIAAAGLNWVRLPVPFWAIDAWKDVGVDATGNHVSEPYLPRVAWPYIVRFFGWCRKYGLRVNLDLHAMPGSQNGYNHSGHMAGINFLRGVMGIANAQRGLDYIRTYAQFISQPEWKDVVTMFSIMNEPRASEIGKSTLGAFYLRVHDIIRSITGIGEGKGPFITLHEGFMPINEWVGMLPNADRVGIDTHPYFAFGGPNREPINVTALGSTDPSEMGGKWPKQACETWGGMMNSSRSTFGVAVGGEFSNGFNDCALWLSGVGNGAQYGDCTYWENSDLWSKDTKAGLYNFVTASMDALGDWFFWTWKIGESTTTNTVRAPLWSYKLGLEKGWMPTDPRKAHGTCSKFADTNNPWDGQYQPWQTGGAGAGTIPASVSQDLAWPPATILGVPPESVTALPQYTSTATPATLPFPDPTPAPALKAQHGDGWFNKQDTAPAVGPINGCAYPNAYGGADLQIPASGCLPAGP